MAANRMLSSRRTNVGRVCTLGALLLATLPHAAADVVEDHSTWLQFFLAGPLLDGPGEARRWRYAFDTPQRFGNDSRQYSQGAWRAAVGYRLVSAWSVWAGYVYTFSDTPYARAPSRESRPFQQLVWAGRRADFDFQYRFRCEQRCPDTGDDTGVRLRHQFRVSHPVPGIAPLSGILSGELFLNLNSTDWGARRGLDQHRLFAGCGWRWSETTRSEAGYLRQFINRSGQPNRVNHAIFLTLALSFR